MPDDALELESQREQSISHKDEFLTSDGIQLFVQGNILMDSGVSFQVFRRIDSCDTPADPFSALEGNSKYFLHCLDARRKRRSQVLVRAVPRV